MEDPSQFDNDDPLGSMQSRVDKFHDSQIQRINMLQHERQSRFAEIGLKLSSIMKEQ